MKTVSTLLLLALPAAAVPVSITNSSFEANRNFDQSAALTGGGFARGESRDFGENGEDTADETGDESRITGWTTIATENETVPGAQVAVGFRDLIPADPTGVVSAPFPQALSLMAGAATYQETPLAWSALTAGEVLRLTISVGDRSTGATWADQSFFGLTDGSPSGSLASGTLRANTVANSGELTAPPSGIDFGTMADVMVNHTVTPADVARSGNVGIVLAGFGSTSTGDGLGSNVNQAFFDQVRLDRLPPVPPPLAGPNLLFLFLDDLRWDAIGFTGNKVITTPNMDTLASQGTIFENAFSTTAICMVSRASVFMGQHMKRHAITAFNQNITAANWQNSYPDRLDDAGYYMGFIGKHGLGDGFIGLYGTYDFNKAWDGQGRYFNQTIDGEPSNGHHTTKLVGDLAVDFIADAANPAFNPAAAPFCLQVSFKAPHVYDTTEGGEFQPDPAYNSLYTAATIPHAKTDTQAQFDNLPSFLKAAGSASTIRWTHRFGTEQKHQDNIKKHHRLIHGVDVQIGYMLAALDDPNKDGNTADSQLDNTIIILSSDHGFFLGERRQAGKWYIQEESIRVPLVIYDPRLPASLKGKRVPQMALNIDIPATLLDYAGVAIPSVMQGRSLKPIVEAAPPADWRTAFLHDHPAVNSVVFRSEGVRTETFSYARYPNNGNVKQLYDVTVDPYQRTNLAADPRYASKLAEMDALTIQLLTEAQ